MLLAIIIIINIIGFAFMGMDKSNARKGEWRIPEIRFFVLTLLGGGVGVYLGMKMFNHKTRKNLFRFGVPLITLLYICLLVLYFYIFNGL
ncbi:DUF1294 domain-containing protein [Bacillus carboniphilus]|uniref:DUF1294 domain-containing protein n=1 Tax=Bacillus carboniphilus TaxID=86663 RepID=A0ABY9JSN0_9BACI|nr:DUF1294 domain-containing protein [Bacillus carboniphilus]WLR42357.1 DUF1294 domain-containing protein [Bacillus carboniphilus]